MLRYCNSYTILNVFKSRYSLHNPTIPCTLGGLVITEPLTTKDVVQIGSNITLRCSYDSYENIEIRFRWYIGLRQLRKSQRVKITRLSKKTSLLEIENAKSSDTGSYTCKVGATKNRKAEKKQMIVVVGRWPSKTLFYKNFPTFNCFDCF